MQDQYAGDIGDYGKLGLLRQLEAAGLSLGVSWYLSPGGGSAGDGRFIEYLREERFRPCDPELWEALGCLVREGRRSVSSLEAAGLLRAAYYSVPMIFPRQGSRELWQQGALTALSGAELIFCDPDNGLMVPSARGRRRIKYVRQEELAAFYGAGKSVLFYQHKARRKDFFYQNRLSVLRDSGAFPEARALLLKFSPVSQRFYCFLLRPEHQERAGTAVRALLSSPFGAFFEALPLS